MFELLVKIVAAFVRNRDRRNQLKASLHSWHYGRRLRRKAKRMDGDVYCGGPVAVYCDQVELGEHVCFNGASLLGRGRIRIGHHFHSGGNLVIMTESHNYEGDAVPYDDTFIVKDVEIAECVWVGYGVTILPGTKIGTGAIIQAGSVVHGDVPAYAIAGGNPAKVFASRDKEHFDKLVREGRFH